MTKNEDVAISSSSSSCPSLWSTPCHFRSTRRGKIIKDVNERYLRDDLGLGFVMNINPENSGTTISSAGDVTNSGDESKCIESGGQLLSLLLGPDDRSSDETSDTKGTQKKHGNKKKNNKRIEVLVLDANVLIHNLDILEHASRALKNLVIPQTSLQECKHNSLSAYNRVLSLLKESDPQSRCVIFFPNEYHRDTQLSSSSASSSQRRSANDKNDALIRNVARFYGSHLQSTPVDVILLTDDAQSRSMGNDDDDGGNNYQARSVRHHVKLLEQRDPTLALSDLLAQFGSVTAAAAPVGNDNINTTATTEHSPHLSSSELSLGIKSGRFYQGVIRCKRGSQASHVDCYVTVRQGDERIAVTVTSAHNVNRAVDGDIVALQLHSFQDWNTDPTAAQGNNNNHATGHPTRAKVGIAPDTAEPTLQHEENIQQTTLRPTGKVVGIIRRNFRQNYCGSVHVVTGGSHHNVQEGGDDNVDSARDAIAHACDREHADGSVTCVFFAVDARVPPILIRTSQKKRLEGKRILTAIDSWPVDSAYPLGHYVKTIGDSGLKDVETEVLLHEHDIPCAPFSNKVLACLPSTDYKIDIENSPGRLDLRHLPVLSIDPPGCKDIDDALHCTILPNGNYQVGVHIADVTHYVKPNTEIDKEASNRSTSTYLVNKRLDMLPKLLTTDLCSLKGNVDRYAFSILWEVTPDAQIIDVDFRKTIIHSIAALTYQQAQALIDQPDDRDDIQAGAVKRLAVLARKFRKLRIDAGALTLASPEVKFTLDSESLNPTDVQAYALFEANALVEEFMLLANVTVGKKILRHYPTLCVLRRHPSPNRSMFDSFISKAKSKGFHIDIDDSKRLADSLDSATLPSDPYFNKLLRILSTRCMSPAQYFCSGEYKPSDWHHYGLAAPVYTHFTSPIRRYADVCVHRLLAASIAVDPLPVHLSSKAYLHDLTANMNRRHRAAQMAGRASVQLHTLIFFSGVERDAKEEVAYVLDVDDTSSTAAAEHPSFTVIVPRYGIEGRVVLPHIKTDDPLFEMDPEQHRMTYNKDASLRVFDQVRVRIWVKTVQGSQKELVLDLVHPHFGSKGDSKKKRPSSSEDAKRKGKRGKKS